jgi:two-component system, LytTR family, response regulator
MKAVIVDDEKDGVRTLISLLKMYCPQVDVVATAHSAKEGIAVAASHNFDLMFLDIKMPQGSGFDLLDALEKIDFEVIITSAYDQYAIKAFRFSAIDYLMKPVDEDELVEAVARVEKRLQTKERLIPALKEARENLKPGSETIAISTVDSIIFIEIKNIVLIAAEGSYSRIVLSSGEKVFTSKMLKDFETLLEDRHFFRVHKSFLINLRQMKKISKQDGGYVIMNDETSVEIAQRRKSELWRVLGLD